MALLPRSAISHQLSLPTYSLLANAACPGQTRRHQFTDPAATFDFCSFCYMPFMKTPQSGVRYIITPIKSPNRLGLESTRTLPGSHLPQRCIKNLLNRTSPDLAPALKEVKVPIRLIDHHLLRPPSNNQSKVVVVCKKKIDGLFKVCSLASFNTLARISWKLCAK